MHIVTGRKNMLINVYGCKPYAKRKTKRHLLLKMTSLYEKEGLHKQTLMNAINKNEEEKKQNTK